MRDAIEMVIKEQNMDRSRLFEVSKLRYQEIIRKIEERFVLHGGGIHWSSITNAFNPNLPCVDFSIANHPDWYHLLGQIVPDPEQSVYVLFEDRWRNAKYWLYEMYLPEFINMMDQLCSNDFYIISKKMDWLISENHEEVVSLVGDSLNSVVLRK